MVGCDGDGPFQQVNLQSQKKNKNSLRRLVSTNQKGIRRRECKSLLLFQTCHASVLPRALSFSPQLPLTAPCVCSCVFSRSSLFRMRWGSVVVYIFRALLPRRWTKDCILELYSGCRSKQDREKSPRIDCRGGRSFCFQCNYSPCLACVCVFVISNTRVYDSALARGIANQLETQVSPGSQNRRRSRCRVQQYRVLLGTRLSSCKPLCFRPARQENKK